MPTITERKENASPLAHYAHEKACLADAVSFSQTLKPPKFPPEPHREACLANQAAAEPSWEICSALHR